MYELIPKLIIVRLSRKNKLPKSEKDAISLTNLYEKMVELEILAQNLEE